MAVKLPNPFPRRNTRAPRSPDGQMTLFEHLGELRNRLLKAIAVIVLGMIVAWFFYDFLFGLLEHPFDAAKATLAAKRHITAEVNFGNIGSPLLLQIKICAVAALIITCPLWLYQIWAFITPGLPRNERKWTYIFIGTAAPLFFSGIVVGYVSLPKGLSVLINFTPDNAWNIIGAEEYYSFILRMLLIFGVAFEIPIFVVVLNMVGVLTAAVLTKARPGIIFGIFVFAAVATPSTDPFTMLLLAVPMTILFIASEIIARSIERRRRARLAAMGIDTSIDVDD